MIENGENDSTTWSLFIENFGDIWFSHNHQILHYPMEKDMQHFTFDVRVGSAIHDATHSSITNSHIFQGELNGCSS